MVSVPFRGSYISNAVEMFINAVYGVSVPFRGSYISNYKNATAKELYDVFPSPSGDHTYLTLSPASRINTGLRRQFAGQNQNS